MLGLELGASTIRLGLGLGRLTVGVAIVLVCIMSVGMIGGYLELSHTIWVGHGGGKSNYILDVEVHKS